MRTSRVLSAIVLALSVAGCGGSPAAPAAPAVQAGDSVSSVINVVPVPGTALQAGQVVTFSGTPGYSLASADVGTVVMVIQDQSNRILQASGAQPVIVVHRGTGDVTLSQTVTLPGDGVTSVFVYFVLAPVDAAQSYASVRLAYPVR